MTKRSEIQRQLMREDLPYGERTFADGTKELFNRKYETIARRGVRTTDEMVSQHWFYNDSNPPWLNAETQRKCLSVWEQWSPR